MVVVDQFYQIVEAQTARVSRFWKVAHIFICFTSALTSLITAFTFGRILDNFGYNCVLNTKLHFDPTATLNTSKHPPALDLTMTQWGFESTCDFIQFTPLVMMISALVWGTYFSILARGGAGFTTDLLSRPWSIIYPCLFFTSIFFITYVISALELKDGIKQFCNQFNTALNNTGCVREINDYSMQFHESDRRNVIFYEFYMNMYVCIVSADLGIWSWVCHLVLCVLRVLCVADFELQLVTIETKEEECLENVVELSDDTFDEVSEV